MPSLNKIREESVPVIVVALNWPTQPWFPDLKELLTIKKDLLFQASGTLWNPSLDSGTSMLGCFRVTSELEALHARALNTLVEA